MSAVIEVPKDYGYVLLAATTSFAVGLWHGIRVGPFRKAAAVPYPFQYPALPTDYKVSKETVQYTCAQRAHYNWLENYSIFLPSLLISGLKYPLAASGCAAAWIGLRIVYAMGYTRADKDNGKGRISGLAFVFPQLALMFLTGKLGYDMTMA